MSSIDRLKAKLRNAAQTVEIIEETVPSGNVINEFEKNQTIHSNELVVDNQNMNSSVILSQKVIEVNILDVQSNPFQPRTNFENIEELAENILKHGLLQPITVYFNDSDAKYYLIAGERRLRAIKLLIESGQLSSTSFKVNLIENFLSNDDKKVLATLENTYRENMTIIDTANNAASYVASGMSYSEVASLFGVGKTVISRYMRIAKLPKKVQDILNTNEVKSPNKIELLSEINNIDKQLEFAKSILEDISIAQLETKIKKYLKSIKDDEKTILIETTYDKIKPVSKVLSKARYRKLTETDKAKVDEILEEIYKLELKLENFVK